MRYAYSMLLPIALALAGGSPAHAQNSDVSAGEAFAKQRCFVCHDRARLLKLAARTPEAERAAKWQKFLPGHSAPNEEDRARVIAWMLAETAQR